MEYLVKNHSELGNEVHTIPEELDSVVAGIKLRTMNVSIDSLTDEQQKYIRGWEEGT